MGGLWGIGGYRAGWCPQMLTDKELKAAKQREKPYKLCDGFGLYVEVKPNGSKLWRLKCRYVGRLAAIIAGNDWGVYTGTPFRKMVTTNDAR